MAVTSARPDVPGSVVLHDDGADPATLAARIRAFLVDRVGATGGHLGPNLGVVELTIALHRVFDSPRDTLLFDTGHQAHVHKILTGRQDGFAGLRTRGGMSGYASRAESEHDHFENPHASTAMSYADPLATARALSGKQDRRVVAVMGDGALTGGLALEALNNIGAAPERPVIVVLNDNGRSYAPTVGALASHLRGLRRALQGAGGGSRFASLTRPSTLFGLLGFDYVGPVDGHDVPALERALRRAASLNRPVVVHTVTVKGKGHPPAEDDPDDHLHTVGPRPTGTTASAASPPGPRWTEVFSAELLRLADEREDVVAVTAALPGPTGLAGLAAARPGRCFDVGIAEQHAVASAAGLAMEGHHPVVAVYATFLNRAFDRVLMDVALHRLPLTLVLDRAGVTGPDGPSHHGMWDLSILSSVPGMRIAAPRDATSLRTQLREAVDHHDGPTAVRFPKGTAAADTPAHDRLGTVDVLVRAAVRDVLIVAVGPLAPACLRAAERLTSQGIATTVVDPRWVIPVSADLVRLAATYRLVVTVEDNVRAGGAGAALAQACRDDGLDTPVAALGLPTAFLPHGTCDELLRAVGLDTEGIVYSVLRARAGASLDDDPRRLWRAP